MTVEAPLWEEAWRIVTLRAGYNTAVVTVAATLLGVAAGVCGTFALLRKRALVGDAVAHATLPGIAVAFLVASAVGVERKSLPILLTGAAVTGVLGLLSVQALTRYTRLRDDAAIAVVLSVFFGAGIVLLSYIQSLSTGTQAGLHHFIYGQTANLRLGDAWVMAALAVATIVVSVLLFKEFRLVAFDDAFAAVQGWPVGRIDLAMMALIILTTIVGLQSVGLLLVVALLIIPAAAARFWTERLSRMTLIAGLIGGLSGALGSACSALFEDAPAGAVIVLVAGSLFLVSIIAAPARGLLASGLRRGRVSLRVLREHVLRSMYESLEVRGAAAEPGAIIEADDLSRMRRSFSWSLPVVLGWMRVRGLLRRAGDGAALTEAGLAQAAAVTRNHRLWEAYLVRYAHLAPTHVDRTADLLEHVVSEGVMAELVASLAPPPDVIPPSVHELDDNREAGG